MQPALHRAALLWLMHSLVQLRWLGIIWQPRMPNLRYARNARTAEVRHAGVTKTDCPAP